MREEPWARDVKVAILRKIVVREPRVLLSSFEVESNPLIYLR